MELEEPLIKYAVLLVKNILSFFNLRIPIKFEMFEDTKSCSRTTDGLNVTCPGNSCHQERFQATSGLEPGKVTKYVDFKL